MRHVCTGASDDHALAALGCDFARWTGRREPVPEAWVKAFSPVRQIAIACCILSIVIALCTLFTLWSLRGFWPDAINLALAYVSVWLICSIPRRHDRLAGGIARNIIGAASVLLALFVYTYLPFVLTMDGRVPDSVVQVRPRLEARISQFGWVTMNTDLVDFYQQPRWFPLIEHRVRRVAHSFSDTCAIGKLRVHGDSGSDFVETDCLASGAVVDRTSIQ